MSDLQNLKDEAQKKGERLGFLIAGLNLSDEVKESLISILPQMTPEQLDRLISILESTYLNAKTAGIDQDFQIALKKIQNGYEKEANSANKNALDDLKKLEKDLDSKE